MSAPSLSPDSSMGGSGGGHSVIHKDLGPFYLTGDYYLAPNGSDASPSCTIDQPCQSINGIQARLSPGKVVLMRGGFYFLNAPISPTTSGSSGSPIVYAAYPGETPIITGARPLGGWIDASGNCAGAGTNVPNCWKTTVPDGFKNFDYLIYLPGGQPSSYVSYAMSRRSQSMSTTTYLRNQCSGNCTNQVVLNQQDVSLLNSNSHNLHDIRYYNFPDSNVDALRIATVTVNGLTTTLTFTGSPSSAGFRNNGRYLIGNSREYFQSGKVRTFYLDCGANACVDQMKNNGNINGATIYYITGPDENLANDVILVPQQTQLVVDGPTNSSIADYITMQGLVLVGDNYLTPDSGFQSDVDQYKATAALSFVNTQGVTIDSTSIAHTSGWAVEFTNPDCNTSGCVTKASKDNQLTNSALYDIGTSALRLGRLPPDKTSDTGNSVLVATQNTKVENNIFESTGRIYPGGEEGCVWIGSAHDNVIQYNECADSYQGGIKVGPRAGYQEAYGYNNLVQYNNLHDLGEGVIVDFGCVHFANWGGVLKNDLGNTFQNNICRDITDAVGDGLQGAAGIYIDGLSQCDTAKNNLVYRSSGSLYFNNTKIQLNPGEGCSNSCPDPGSGTDCRNFVSNNILAYSYSNPNSGGGPIKRGGHGGAPPGGDNFLTFTFKHNIVYFDTTNGPQWIKNDNTGFWSCLTSDGSRPGPCTKYFAFYSNAYWSPKLAGPTFVTTDSSNNSAVPWSLGNSPGQWQSTGGSDPGEDISADGGGLSVFQDPHLKNPRYPIDDYHLAGAPPPIGFDASALDATYQAGRNKPVIFPPPSPATFPLQLLSPFQY